MTNKKIAAIGGFKTGHADVRDDDQGQGNHSPSDGIDADLHPLDFREIESLGALLELAAPRLEVLRERLEGEISQSARNARAKISTLNHTLQGFLTDYDDNNWPNSQVLPLPGQKRGVECG